MQRRRFETDKYVGRKESIPEQFIWHWVALASSHVANLHYPVDFRAEVDPLIHRDIWQGSFFINWESPMPSPAQMPDILLGDFGSAQYVSDGDMGRGPTGIANDIYSIAYILLVMLFGKPLCFAGGDDVQRDQVEDLIPDIYSDEIKTLAVDLSAHVVGTRWTIRRQQIVNWTGPDTVKLALRVIGDAKAVLERDNFVPDLRWTKPEVSTLPAFFENPAALDDWCRVNNHGRELSGRWHLISFNRDTLQPLRRSPRLNPGLYQAGKKRSLNFDSEEEERQSKRLRR